MSKVQKKVSTLVNEAPLTFKPMRHARLRDLGTKERVSLCFQSRGNSHNTLSSERNGKTFTSVEYFIFKLVKNKTTLNHSQKKASYKGTVIKPKVFLMKLTSSF